MISGPATAVNPAKNVSIDFIGPGSLSIKLTIPLTKLIKNVCTFKNSSPIPAKSALSPSIALLYLPEADSVTCFNSRSAIPANSAELAFIRSIT